MASKATKTGSKQKGEILDLTMIVLDHRFDQFIPPNCKLGGDGTFIRINPSGRVSMSKKFCENFPYRRILVFFDKERMIIALKSTEDKANSFRIQKEGFFSATNFTREIYTFVKPVQITVEMKYNENEDAWVGKIDLKQVKESLVKLPKKSKKNGKLTLEELV